MAQAELDAAADKRPLSPHLTVYKPMLTMAMSMAHRISGVALYAGSALLAIYLLALAFGPGAFSAFSWIANGFVGHLFMLLYSWALFHHLLGGVRHAVWDRGLYMDAKGRELITQASLGGSIALTLMTWILTTLAG
ncbi:succinate dehydrogenase, cytochrome b556 subunit [Methylocystis heyeri]|uniref:Succinate dehydrogenase cytochrome b556 subunit n=1 Tax=Methylocystis heyeri TaxID=391905 RepID=A0A6B8K920_9HYPH|nr:succinate dehydrogenase, cytochrome b556 subunit [Methylocystis heyeri]QGM44754.1 succinate dehydrogenase, cytochrome b556 subunit [Methylocystis heyeri]